jgi:ferredoxin
MDLDTQAFVNKEKLNEHECILCGECVSHCPKAAIKRGFKIYSNKSIQEEN